MEIQKKLANILNVDTLLSIIKRLAPHLSVLYFFLKLRQVIRGKWNQTIRDRLGSLALHIPFIASKYREIVFNKQDMEKRSTDLIKSWKDKFGSNMFTEMPEFGWSVEKIKQMVDQWVHVTNVPLKEKCFSGMIYSNSFTEQEQKVERATTTSPVQIDLKGPADFAALSKNLRSLYQYSFSKSYLWNSLHITEFTVGYYVMYQLVSMVASMYGGDSKEVLGFVTSGGTGSIMLACRAYREWGMRTRGLDIGESIILAGDSVHAAFNKAGAAYHMKVIQCRCNRAGEMDLKHLKKLLRKYGRKVVLIVGSAPNYPTGVVDPIKELAKIAKKAKCGLHVDCCLGGFVINNLDHIDTDFLAIDGVTSLSCDTHKNGWAPKGSSVLVTRDMHDPLLGQLNLGFYAGYSFPNWSGGFYGTPQEPGSQQCTSALHAFLAMVAIGKNGYKKIAQSIYQTCQNLANSIKKYPELKLTVEPQVNVVTFETSSTCNWGKGSIYAFSHTMNRHGFQLSALRDKQLHICVTGRLAGNEDLEKKFDQAIADSIKEINSMAVEVKNGKRSWPGDAGLYGQLDAAMSPSSTNTKDYGELVGNWLIGKKVIEDTIRMYFYTFKNPYKKA